MLTSVGQKNKKSMRNLTYLKFYLDPLFQLAEILPKEDQLYNETKERISSFIKQHGNDDEKSFKKEAFEVFGPEVAAAVNYVTVRKLKSSASSLFFMKIVLIASLVLSLIAAFVL
ncbi:MAG: hypothetical protein KUL83_05200 [Lentimicrobium sp.]|jgi:hypothetical protein|nr:hypothetical protein [Lentimicrobium sp.]MDD2528288.1 hypothetical protein [Lentimicrobiaceae bacterium]MDD4598016.1 hypothetical protein [Lentimicrobiaceae bacterium]MDY0025177.1 hypothetical protein [Lentimicrobium sp.]HAH57450.1 hypothetical protein [Bacteroidales bacterium]